MRVGMSVTSTHKVSSPRDGARWMIEQAAAAHGSDLDSLFVGDHHSTAPRSYYQNVPIMARMLAEWGDKPAGVLFLLPVWNPVLVADQITTLAAIHQGRFIMQCGLGYEELQSRAMGVNHKFRPSMFEESLSIVQRLLAGERVSSNGRFKFSEAQVAPLPAEPVEVWIGGSASQPIDRAARMGDGWLAAPGMGLDELAGKAAEYRERVQIHGREPKAVVVRRNVFVGKTDEDAARVVGPLLAGPSSHELQGDPSSLLYGSAETVAKQIKPLADLGFTDVLMRSMVADQRLTLESIERLGEVRERVRDL